MMQDNSDVEPDMPDIPTDHIQPPDLTAAQQTELLQALWQIMSTMVDIGWSVDSVQMLLPEDFQP